MKSYSHILALGLACVLPAAAGCASARAGGAPGAPAATAAPTAPAAAAAAQDPLAGAVVIQPPRDTTPRIPNLTRPITDADIHFMNGMIGHHAQAVVMSKWAATHGAGEPVRKLAERIAVGQEDEIVLMQEWLRDQNQPVPVPNPAGVRMKMDGMEHDMLMPGMLTPEQMSQLDRARGVEFDRLFLTFMIQHHHGAIAMVEALNASPGAAQDDAMFKFVSDVFADQTTEIAHMEQMLVTINTEKQS